ncbi:MAG: helix-turn-helix transcriptional regulator [Bacilli bacterium]|nr:helix-turn-helix transcriptional regulator [Bacilli bacterium]
MEEVYKFESEKKLYSIIGNNIKYYRKLYSITKSDMTQKDLAKLINVSTSLIGNLESKNTYQGISVYNLYKISKVLEVPMDNFFINH